MSIVLFTRDKIIDRILMEPGISLTQLAQEFGYTVPWLSIITNSDAFRERLEERKGELTDPMVAATLNDRIRALAAVSSEVLIDKVSVLRDPNLAVKALEATAKWLAPRNAPQAQVTLQQNFVAVVPEKRRNASDWLAAHAPGGPQPTVPLLTDASAESGVGG